MSHFTYQVFVIEKRLIPDRIGHIYITVEYPVCGIIHVSSNTESNARAAANGQILQTLSKLIDDYYNQGLSFELELIDSEYTRYNGKVDYIDSIVINLDKISRIRLLPYKKRKLGRGKVAYRE